MTGELIPTGVTFGAGRNSINEAFSGTAEFNNIVMDSGADLYGGAAGGTIYSGGTDLYNIFSTSGGSTFTGNTSATSISDIYVSNIHSPSLNLNPLDEGSIFFSSASGFTYDTVNNRLGLNNSAPAHVLDAINTDGSTFYLDATSSVSSGARMTGVSTKFSSYQVVSPNVGGIQIGVIGEDTVVPSAIPHFGQTGDTFIYSSAAANGLNIISKESGGSTKDYIRFYAGNDGSLSAPGSIGADIHIQGKGGTRGYVGFNEENPTEQIHVNGSIKVDNGSVGINTTASPGLALDVVGRVLATGGGAHSFVSTGGSPYNVIQVIAPSVPAGLSETFGIHYSTDDNSSVNRTFAKVASYVESRAAGSVTGGLAFGTAIAGTTESSPTTKMTIDSAGNVEVLSGNFSAGTSGVIYSGGTDLYNIFGAGGSGEVNTVSSVGTGNSLFKQKTGVDLEFRSLSAGTNIVITTGDTITINSGGATYDFGTTSGIVAWDLLTTSRSAKITLNGNVTALNISNMTAGDFGTLKITQTTGGHTLVLGTGTHIVSNGGAGAVTLTATAGAKDIISFSYDGTEFSWNVGNDYT